MAVVTLEQLKAQLNLTDDNGEDNELLIHKIVAAESHFLRQLGFSMEAEYPDGVPADLREGVLQLAAHWYENREATLIGVSGSPLPFGIQDIINSYRSYSFDG